MVDLRDAWDEAAVGGGEKGQRILLLGLRGRTRVGARQTRRNENSGAERARAGGGGGVGVAERLRIDHVLQLHA